MEEDGFMRSLRKGFIAAIVFSAIAGSYALPAQAMGKIFWGDHGGKGGGGNGGSSNGGGGGSSAGGSNRGAPGPIAGAGLPSLLIAGGYALVRRYRKNQ